MTSTQQTKPHITPTSIALRNLFWTMWSVIIFTVAFFSGAIFNIWRTFGTELPDYDSNGFAAATIDGAFHGPIIAAALTYLVVTCTHIRRARKSA